MTTDENEYIVNNEFDIVVLRQAVRQVARTLDLSLVQQARITAAISDIARSSLHHHWPMLFTIHVHAVDLRHALDVVCQKPAHQTHPSNGEFESQLQIDSARQLLDDASFSHPHGYPLLTLRIWI